MLYLGGKGRAGKHIAKVILDYTSKRECYLEPFLGGGNSFKHLAPHFARTYAGDVSEDLILMWRKATYLGWVPPVSVSEEEYKELRNAAPSALRGFVGFGCSFGGKFFGGYARSKQNGKDYYARHNSESVVEIAKIMKEKGTWFRPKSFDRWIVNKNDVIYCDPPYANTTGYKNKFDSEYFWQVMNKWSDLGATVFVSEYYAPDGWKPIWERSQHRKIGRKGGGTDKITIEKLFVKW